MKKAYLFFNKDATNPKIVKEIEDIFHEGGLHEDESIADGLGGGGFLFFEKIISFILNNRVLMIFVSGLTWDLTKKLAKVLNESFGGTFRSYFRRVLGRPSELHLWLPHYCVIINLDEDIETTEAAINKLHKIVSAKGSSKGKQYIQKGAEWEIR